MGHNKCKSMGAVLCVVRCRRRENTICRIQEVSPQGRFATGRFATKLEDSPQLWKVRHKCHKKVRHNVRMHYKTSYYCLLNAKIYLFH